MDTVSYRIHNVDTYPYLKLAVKGLEKATGGGLVEDSPKLEGVSSFRKFWFSMDKDKIHLMTYNARVNLPSSNDGITVRYDPTNKYVSFEFSLPKYFFGNNVIEIIPPPQSKWFNVARTDMISLQAEYWYQLMWKAIQGIVSEFTQRLERFLDPKDVEVHRFDICFNQIFINSSDAKHYIDSIGRVMAPRIRDGKRMVYDNMNITFKTDNYYFKVYQKGLDFASNGVPKLRKTFDELWRKKLVKKDSNLERSMSKIAELQSYADRILRYELECTSKFMSYAFNTKLKRPSYIDKEWQTLRRIIEYLMREENYELLTKVKLYKRFEGKLFPAKVDLLGRKFEWEYYTPNPDDPTKIIQITNVQTLERVKKIVKCSGILRTRYNCSKREYLKMLHKYFQAEKSREHKFFFALDNQLDKDFTKVRPVGKGDGRWPEAEILEKTPEKQLFSVDLICLCIQKHQSLFKCLQFANLPDIKNVEMMVKEYNQRMERQIVLPGQKKEPKMNVNQMKQLFLTFKNNTWEEMRKSGNITRKTLYNYKQKCYKLFGFENSINYMTTVQLENVSREPKRLYFRHFNELIMPNSVLAEFVKSTPSLM